MGFEKEFFSEPSSLSSYFQSSSANEQHSLSIQSAEKLMISSFCLTRMSSNEVLHTERDFEITDLALYIS